VEHCEDCAEPIAYCDCDEEEDEEDEDEDEYPWRDEIDR
jgi:hypothetical protein